MYKNKKAAKIVKRKEMIKDKKIFNHMIKNSKFKKNIYYVIYYEKNNNDNTLYGIAISNKYGHAVERNKIKRITRAIIDENRNLFQKNFNYIIMIRKSAKKAFYHELNENIINILKEINNEEKN